MTEVTNGSSDTANANDAADHVLDEQLIAQQTEHVRAEGLSLTGEEGLQGD